MLGKAITVNMDSRYAFAMAHVFWVLYTYGEGDDHLRQKGDKGDPQRPEGTGQWT